MRMRTMTLGIAVAALAVACAGTPGPGEPGYAYNLDGLYSGRLMVEGEPFDATLDLRTSRGGRVRGSFRVRSPLEIDGRLQGILIDDLLRIDVTYPGGDATTPGGLCENGVQGILSVSRGGGIVEGPVTIADCGDTLAGRMSFRRRDEPS